MVIHHVTRLLAEDIGPKWLYWPWVSDHYDEITTAFREHVSLTFWAVLGGLVIALPLGIACSRWRWLYVPTIAATSVLFTIPSLALFAFLIPVTGLSRETALIPLVAYTLLILVRNVVIGLDAVPGDVVEAAQGMGYSRARSLVKVELPLALPTIMTGVRIATVTTIGLVTVTATIGQGGLGQLMFTRGFQIDFRTPVTVATLLVVAFAVAADVSLLGLQRLATPWLRKQRV